ncbi:hypothetical protein [Chroococcidiopsis thermalis]|nr:hypothetical protein [Chroococcidiopsis thermalis]
MSYQLRQNSRFVTQERVWGVGTRETRETRGNSLFPTTEGSGD